MADPFLKALGINPDDPLGLSGGPWAPRDPWEATVSRASPGGFTPDPIPTRGLRNNNPGNIEWGPFARSMGATGTDGRFAIFPDAETGRKAQERLLGNYISSGTNTVQGVIDRWAPPSEAMNARARTNYIGHVSSRLGVRPDQPLSPSQIPRLADAIAEFENGPAPPRSTSTPSRGRTPMADPFSRLFPTDGGAASTGQVDMLDILGIGTNARSRFAAEQGATRRTEMTLQRQREKEVEERAIADADRAALAGLQAEFGRRLQATGGNTRMAFTGLLASEPFMEAFARNPSAVNTFIQTMPQFLNSLVDPGQAVRDQLGTRAQPQAAPGPDAADPGLARPVQQGALSNLTPEQQQALDAASRISPQATATAVGQRLTSQALPGQGEPFTLNAGARRFSGTGEEIAANPRPPVPDAQMGRVLAQRVGRVSEDGDAAAEMQGQLQELRTALQGVRRGAGFWSRVAGHFNVPTGNSDIETVQAIVNKLAPQQRVPGSGASSDRDVAIFFRALPSLLQSAAGQDRILDTMDQIVADRIQRGDIANRALAGEISAQQAFEQLRELRNPFQREDVTKLSDADLRALARNEAAMANPEQRERVLSEMRRRRDAK